MRRLKATNTTNSELRSSLGDADNTLGTLRAVLAWKSVVGFPARVSESVANTYGAWRYDACVAVGTLPCGVGEAGHDVGAAAWLTPKGGCYTSAVHARMQLH